MPDPARLNATIASVNAMGTGPQRVSDLISGGITRGQVRAAIDSGRLFTLRRGIVVPRLAWDDSDWSTRRRWALSASLTAFRGSWASRDSASRLWDLPDFGLARDDVGEVPSTHISCVGSARSDGWLTVHGGDAPTDSVVEFDGIRTTDLVRTSIECAATRSRRSALVVIDAAMRAAVRFEYGESDLREAVVDPAIVSTLRLRWRKAVGQYARHRWVTRVRDMVEWADPAAESVLESLSRFAILTARLPCPQIGVRLLGDDDRPYWVDMWWPKFGVFGEADGLSKYSDISAMVAEKRRHEALEGRGWRGVRWGWAQTYPDPTVMLSRIGSALAAPHTPPRRPEWS